MEADGFFLITRRKPPVIFELEKQIFNQMPFFVCVPVRFPRMSCTVTARNDRNTSTFFDPMNKTVAVMASISKDHLSGQLKRLQYFSCQANVIPVSTGK